MKGFIYICKMNYEGKSYYKVGRTLRPGRRESDLRIGNPFLSVVAMKQSTSYEKDERIIQKSLQPYHYFGEWFELNDQQYADLYNQYDFSVYTEGERRQNIKQEQRKRPQKNDFHVFKKPKKLKNGETVRRWYYYFINEEGKQIQKACRGCKTRTEAENYIRNIQEGKEP
jgi:hypothetical protein